MNHNHDTISVCLPQRNVAVLALGVIRVMDRE